MRPILAVLLCVALAGCVFPSPSTPPTSDLRLPVSVSFQDARFGAAQATGYIERKNGVCHEGTYGVRTPTPGPEAARRLVVEYDHAFCQIRFAIYEQPPEGNGLCGYSCQSPNVPDSEVRANWTLIAGPVTVG